MLALHNPLEAAGWLKSRVRGALHADSRPVGAGDGFVAWPGAATDGRKFVQSALQQGAKACLVERVGSEAYGLLKKADETRNAELEKWKAVSFSTDHDQAENFLETEVGKSLLKG